MQYRSDYADIYAKFLKKKSGQQVKKARALNTELISPARKCLSILKNSFTPDPSSQSCSFHSTSVCLAKWKNKWRPVRLWPRSSSLPCIVVLIMLGVNVVAMFLLGVIPFVVVSSCGKGMKFNFGRQFIPGDTNPSRKVMNVQREITQAAHHMQWKKVILLNIQWCALAECGVIHEQYKTVQIDMLCDKTKALKDLLFNSGSHKISFEDENLIWTDDEPISRNDKEDGKQPRAKKSARRAKSHSNRNKRRQHHASLSDDSDGYPGKIFEATFGGRCFTWSFSSCENSHFQNSTPGFEWREDSHWKKSKRRKWETSETDDDYDDEPAVVGSHSDRTTLGLPLTGPLKMEDVKSAFRASALKWHPDKHHGPSQVMAAEKFKLCVNAYKSLCNALSTR
ncbi:hypothetical protein ACLOJK_025726 [Asimina triloba]